MESLLAVIRARISGVIFHTNLNAAQEPMQKMAGSRTHSALMPKMVPALCTPPEAASTLS